ncbi:hypothetical protein [Paraliobacillus sp. JSM ZJ581]|uniref:hypothetical protein n=1 Tax=Paraliobacillus sp. JSM ZJ581 TaxID=3342118 RepID=UPI0035A93A18
MNILNGMLAAMVAFSSGVGLSLFSGEEDLNQANLFERQAFHFEEMIDWAHTGDFKNMDSFMKNNNMSFDHMRSFRVNNRNKPLNRQNHFQEKTRAYDKMKKWMNAEAFESRESDREQEQIHDEQMGTYMNEVHKNSYTQDHEDWSRGMHRNTNANKKYRGMSSMHN